MNKKNCPLGLTTTIGAAAAAISKNLSDEEITFFAAVLMQLSDTLYTILAQRACQKVNEESGKEIDSPNN